LKEPIRENDSDELRNKGTVRCALCTSTSLVVSLSQREAAWQCILVVKICSYSFNLRF